MTATALTSPRLPDAAAPAEAPARGQACDRRGPFRPERLATTRRRVSGRMLSRLYHALDALLIGGAAAAGWTLADPHRAWAHPLTVAAPFFAAAVLVAGVLDSVGAYGLRPRESLAAHLLRTGLGFAICAAALTVFLAVGRPPAQVARGLTIDFGLCFAGLGLLHAGWWSHVRALRRSGRLTPNIVVVGATPSARRLIAHALESRDVAVLGVFDDRHGRAPDAVLGVPLLGDTAALVGHRIMPYVDQVVIAVAATAQARVRDLVERLGVLPNEITLFVDQGAAPAAQDAHAQALSRMTNPPLARLSGRRAGEGRALAKRLQDLVLGSLALLAAAPVMAIVALAIRLDTAGPIFFRQVRQGFNNEEIVVWKFRSMRHDLRDEQAERQVSESDPRVTRVGRFIRRTSLDELPQLFNVLAGEMSLVGPRPHAPHMKTGDVESALLVAQYAHRHRLKPGMTGWAAINGSLGPMPQAEDVRRRVGLDLEYIERQSFWFDLYILLMTPPRLIGGGRVTR
jgi:Undecaprenyl-phosphate glucose phosphotransferase